MTFVVPQVGHVQAISSGPAVEPVELAYGLYGSYGLYESPKTPVVLEIVSVVDPWCPGAGKARLTDTGWLDVDDRRDFPFLWLFSCRTRIQSMTRRVKSGIMTTTAIHPRLAEPSSTLRLSMWFLVLEVPATGMVLRFLCWRVLG